MSITQPKYGVSLKIYSYTSNPILLLESLYNNEICNKNYSLLEFLLE